MRLVLNTETVSAETISVFNDTQEEIVKYRNDLCRHYNGQNYRDRNDICLCWVIQTKRLRPQSITSLPLGPVITTHMAMGPL